MNRTLNEFREHLINLVQKHEKSQTLHFGSIEEIMIDIHSK